MSDLTTIPSYPPHGSVDTEHIRLIGEWTIYPTTPNNGEPHIVHHPTINMPLVHLQFLSPFAGIDIV